MRSSLIAIVVLAGLATACAGPESVARRDAREAIARGDYRLKPPETMTDAESRRYGMAFNAIIVTEQPFIAPANDLEHAMVALARNPSKATERAFEIALLTSKVYLPTTREGVAETTADPTRVTVLRLPIEPGRPHAMVVFTSPARLRQSLHNETEWPWLALSGRQALATAVDHPIVVNHGLRPPVHIEPEQIARLLAQNPAP